MIKNLLLVLNDLTKITNLIFILEIILVAGTDYRPTESKKILF
jgi:hypothetical protein